MGQGMLFFRKVVRRVLSEKVAFGQRQRREGGGQVGVREKPHQAGGRASAKAGGSMPGVWEEGEETGELGNEAVYLASSLGVGAKCGGKAPGSEGMRRQR